MTNEYGRVCAMTKEKLQKVYNSIAFQACALIWKTGSIALKREAFGLAPGKCCQPGIAEQSDKRIRCIISLVITTVYTSAAGHLSTSKGAERKVKPKWVLVHPLREKVSKGGEGEEEESSGIIGFTMSFPTKLPDCHLLLDTSVTGNITNEREKEEKRGLFLLTSGGTWMGLYDKNQAK